MAEPVRLHSRNDEQSRRLAESMRRQLGEFYRYMREPDVTEISLNPDGQVWVDRLGQPMQPVGVMRSEAAETFIGNVASIVRLVVNYDHPLLQCRLPLDGSRFQATLPPVSASPIFSIRRHASSVFTLADYEQQGVMSDLQRLAIEESINDRRNILVTGGTTSGKAQPLDAKVLTPTGFRKIGELRVGDPITGPDGRTARVTGIYPQGEKEIFSVGFTDGRAVECCGNHLWKIWTRTSEYAGGGRYAPKKRSMGWKVFPLHKIQDRFAHRRLMWDRLAVPLVEADSIELPAQHLPIPPYVLGALLGDGGLTGLGVKFTSADSHILDRVSAEIPEYELASTGSNNGLDYRVRMVKQRKISPLRLALSDLGLLGLASHEKFIPTPYKNGSVAQRLALLQGLFDTDGHVNSTYVDFGTTSECLARDVQEVAWSLGAIAKIKNRQTYYTYKGIKKAGRPSWRVHVVRSDVFSLLSLPRKISACRSKVRHRRLQIASIEAVGKKECRCISIDRADGLYVTDNYVVTHNTTLLNGILAHLAATSSHRMVVCEDTPELQVTAPNSVTLWTSETVTMRQLVVTAMRLRPDRIVIGESRDGAILETLKAQGTGHPGGMTTLHANDPRQALQRIEMLIREVSRDPLRDLIANSIDVIIHIERAAEPPYRRVTAVSSLLGYRNGSYELQPLA